MTEYVFDRNSLNNPEFENANWVQYYDEDGNLNKIVQISDPFVVRTPQGEYIRCEEGYLAVDSSGDVWPVTQEQLDDHFSKKEVMINENS